MTEQEFNELKTKYGLTTRGGYNFLNLYFRNTIIAIVRINNITDIANEKVAIIFDGYNRFRVLNPIAADNKIKNSIVELKQQIIQKKFEDIKKDFE
jgi:hypothetical protein